MHIRDTYCYFVVTITSMATFTMGIMENNLKIKWMSLAVIVAINLPNPRMAKVAQAQPAKVAIPHRMPSM